MDLDVIVKCRLSRDYSLGISAEGGARRRLKTAWRIYRSAPASLHVGDSALQAARLPHVSRTASGWVSMLPAASSGALTMAWCGWLGPLSPFFGWRSLKNQPATAVPRCTAKPWVTRGVACCLGVVSFLIVWSEATIASGTHPDLSPFSHVSHLPSLAQPLS